MGNIVSQTALIQPTSGTLSYARQDFEMAKFRFNNGTAAIAVVGPDGSAISGGGGGASGTTNVGTLNTGTINTGTINNGTFVMPSGTLTTGSIVVTAGTMIQSAGTINTGTVVLNGGTAGLMNTRSGKILVSYGTTSSGTIGTIVAAPGAGTALWVTSLDIIVQSGTCEPVVSFGLVANGAGVLNRGMYGALGGITKTFIPANNGGTSNLPLTWNVLTSSGTVSYNVVYFTEA